MAISRSALDALTAKGAERGVDLRPGLELVEQRLRTAIAADLPLLDQAGRHLMDAGGKRFRPMLVLLGGLLGGSHATDDSLVDAGVIVELVHLSTLYHDDVIDAADMRRGTTAAHVKWSNTVAILTGDFLLARASELSAALGVEVTRVMAATIADLCQGQIREVQGSGEARAHGMPREQVIRDVILASQPSKRFVEPDELGPGLLSRIYDGIQRPLQVLQDKMGDFILRGVDVPGLDHSKKWEFKATAKKGDKVGPGSVLGTVQ